MQEALPESTGCSTNTTTWKVSDNCITRDRLFSTYSLTRVTLGVPESSIFSTFTVNML